MKKPEVIAFSLPGGRALNEDTVLTWEGGNRTIGIVADGLGGQGEGDLASRIAAETAMETLKAAPRVNGTVLRNAMSRANAAVRTAQSAKGSRMMSTLAMAVWEGHQIWISHLGDTRIYRFRGGRMQSCTRDDSVTQALADSGEISRDEMRTHETRNLLLRCLGGKETADPVPEHYLWWGGSRVLICSDGFWEHFEDAELAETIFQGSPAEALDRLKKMAQGRVRENGDNLSALLIGSA